MYDLVLRGGLLYDGTGGKPRRGNLCVQDGKIACITDSLPEGREILDVTGLAVAPGFIDIHTHSDTAHFGKGPVLSQVAQGITTEIVGNCGGSAMPSLPESREAMNAYLRPRKGMDAFDSVTDYARAADEKGAVLHYGTLIGHSNLRVAVMGFVNRDPDEAEMQQLEALLDREMARGAFGMSLGLIYPPSAFSQAWELERLARVIRKYDGILAVHMRNEGPRVFAAVEEMLSIARNTGVHLHISHLKLMGKPQWGRAGELVKILTEACAQGVHVTCDQYPFLASSTHMTALVPGWAHEGGYEAMVKQLENREGDICRAIAKEMENRGGPGAVLLTDTYGRNPQWEAKTVAELSGLLGLTPEETVRHVLIACGGRAYCVYFSMNKGDVLEIMDQTFICVGSDGTSLSHDPARTPHVPHPRNFAAFVRFFQTVREEKRMPLETAVYKATGLTASILNLRDRGLLKEGLNADITVFDPETIGSKADYLESRVWPDGVRHVIVGGVPVIRDGEFTGALPGKAVLQAR